MKFEDARIAIESRFQTGWASGSYPTIPIFFGNAPQINQPEKYLVLKFQEGEARQSEITGSGPAWHRIEGFIQADIYTPENTGTSDAKKYADQVSEIFRRADFSYGQSGRIICRTPNRRDLGSLNGKFWTVVRIPFQRDLRI